MDGHDFATLEGVEMAATLETDGRDFAGLEGVEMAATLGLMSR